MPMLAKMMILCFAQVADVSAALFMQRVPETRANPDAMGLHRTSGNVLCSGVPAYDAHRFVRGAGTLETPQWWPDVRAKQQARLAQQQEASEVSTTRGVSDDELGTDVAAMGTQRQEDAVNGNHDDMYFPDMTTYGEVEAAASNGEDEAMRYFEDDNWNHDDIYFPHMATHGDVAAASSNGEDDAMRYFKDDAIEAQNADWDWDESFHW